MSLFGLELFSPPRIICLSHKVSPPCCSNSTDKREERWGLKSHGSGLRRVCAQRQAARGRRGGCSAAGHRGCGVQGQRGSRSEAPEKPRGEESGRGGAAGTGTGGGGGGPYVWIFLAKGCREACWSCARLQRAPLSPSLSRALKFHPETKTPMCARVTICLLSSTAATPASLASLPAAGNE